MACVVYVTIVRYLLVRSHVFTSPQTDGCTPEEFRTSWHRLLLASNSRNCPTDADLCNFLVNIKGRQYKYLLIYRQHRAATVSYTHLDVYKRQVYIRLSVDW